jgi:hypothetical protein
MVRVSNPARIKDFSLFRNVQTRSVAQTGCYLIGTGEFPGGLGGRGVKLTTHIRLVPRLRMSGVIYLLPLCVYDVDRDDFTFYSYHHHTLSLLPSSLAGSLKSRVSLTRQFLFTVLPKNL